MADDLNIPEPTESDVLSSIITTPAPQVRQPDGKFAKGSVPPPKVPDKEEQGDEDPDAVEDEDQPDSEDEFDEGEEEASSDGDLDEYLVPVTVDGKVVEVSLKELKSKYSGNQYIEKQIHKSVKARQAAEAQAQQLFKVNQVAVGRLNQINAVLKTISEPNIDWERLRETDPQTYFLKRDEQREAREKQEAIEEEIERVQEQQERLASDARSRYVTDQAEQLLVKLPDLSNPQKGKALMEELAVTAEHYGYTRQELGTVVDHRAMMVLNDARKYRQIMRGREKDKDTPAKSYKKLLVKPGVTKPIAQGQAKRLSAQTVKRARESGNPDDVAKTLLVRAPRPMR